jgi:hypothetical protein
LWGGGLFQKLLSASARRAAAADYRYPPADRGAPFLEPRGVENPLAPRPLGPVPKKARA